MYARLAATLHAPDRHRGAAPCGGAAGPVRRRRASCCADLQVIEALAALAPRAGADRAAPGAADARGAGVRLPPRHGRPAPELRQARGGDRRAAARRAHRARLRGAARGRRGARCCCACSTTRGRCACAARMYSRAARWASWRSSRPRARRCARYGREALRHYIISHTEDVSDLLEVLLLQKEAGPAARHARRRARRAT